MEYIKGFKVSKLESRKVRIFNMYDKEDVVIGFNSDDQSIIVVLEMNMLSL